MRTKRGVSPLIATVMLVGFAVALAAIVSTFVIKETKKFNPESFLEESPFCENIFVEAVVLSGKKPSDVRIEKAPNDNTNTFYSLKEMGLKNKGTFTVQRYLVKSGGKEIPILPDTRTVKEGRPGGVTSVAGGIPFAKDPAHKLVIQPAVRDPEKNKVIPCPKQEVRVDYKAVCCNVNECKSGLATTALGLDLSCG